MLPQINRSNNVSEISPQRKYEIKSKFFFLDKQNEQRFSFKRADKILKEFEEVKGKLALVEAENQQIKDILAKNTNAKGLLLQDKIIKIVSSEQKATTQEIARKLSRRVDFVSTKLNRMARSGVIQKIQRGIYAPVSKATPI